MLRIHKPISRAARGFSLIEVLLAIVVLSVGLLALAALQAGLVRNSADAKSRSTGSVIAKDTIEDFRDFSTGSQYNTIADSGATAITRGGTTYSRTVTVSRYVLNPDPNGDGDTSDGGFVINANDTVAIPDTPEFKLVDVTVAWVGAAGDTQRVRYYDTISSVDPSDAALAITPPPPVVRRTPEVRIFPETVSEDGIIPIAIGDDTATAASNPRPQQYTTGVTATTRFTVQTYLEDQTNPLLQQRLDVAATTCKCTLDGSSSTSTNLAFEPSFWDGEKYAVPLGVSGKTTAVEASFTQDPTLCEDCCRDHHDKAGSLTLYDPFRPTSDYTSGKHNHYAQGSNTVAVTGGSYLESCRMIRVDGIFRVATDTRMENMTLLEMDNTSGTAVLPAATVTAYADFARDFVESSMSGLPGVPSYPDSLIPNQLVDGGGNPTGLATTYEGLLDIVDGAGTIDYIGNDDVGGTPTFAVGSIYNMHARGLYIDYLSSDAKFAIDCIGDATDNFECDPFRDKALLELVPFLAINLTNLSGWDQNDLSIIEIGEDPVPTNINTPFVRGDVSGKTNGTALGQALALGGNSGLTNEPGSDPDDRARTLEDNERFVVGTGVPNVVPAPPFTLRVGTVTNLKEANLAVSITVPTLGVGGVDGPCGVMSGNPTGRYGCDYEDQDDGTPASLTLRFGNYNYFIACPNKYAQSPTNACKCDPVGNPAGRPILDRFFNFQLTGLTLPTGALQQGTPYVVGSEGIEAEISEVTISAPAGLTLEQAMLSGSTVTATFSQQTGSACPI